MVIKNYGISWFSNRKVSDLNPNQEPSDHFRSIICRIVDRFLSTVILNTNLMSPLRFHSHLKIFKIFLALSYPSMDIPTWRTWRTKSIVHGIGHHLCIEQVVHYCNISWLVESSGEHKRRLAQVSILPGIPQGSIWWPLLYVLFITNIPIREETFMNIQMILWLC